MSTFLYILIWHSLLTIIYRAAVERELAHVRSRLRLQDDSALLDMEGLARMLQQSLGDMRFGAETIHRCG